MKNAILKLIFLHSILLTSLLSQAQVEPPMIGFNLSYSFQNPAYSNFDSRFSTTFNLSSFYWGKNYYTGIVVSDYAIPKSKFRIGINAFKDEGGDIFDYNSIGIHGNYKHSFNEKTYLSIGARTAWYQNYYDFTKLVTNDPSVPNELVIRNRLDVDLGAWLNINKGYFGISIKHLVRVQQKDSFQFLDTYPVLYNIIGYKWNFGSNFNLEPALRTEILLPYHSNGVRISPSLMFGIKNKYFIGINRPFMNKNGLPFDILSRVEIKEKLQLTANLSVFRFEPNLYKWELGFSYSIK